MRNIEFRNFEIRSVDYKDDSSELYIEGYACVFDSLDSYRSIFNKGCFAKTLQENEGRIAFCYQHEIDEPIGKIEEIYEDDYGLFVRARISDSEEDIKTKIREGILKELSVGFETMISNYDMATDILTKKEVKLWEVSIVTIASNPLSVIIELRSIEEKKDYIAKCFDRIIENESNRNNKFGLLKLRSLYLNNMPEDFPHIEEKPNIEEVKSVFSKFEFEPITN